MKVIISQRARRTLREITAYIAKESPLHARRFATLLRVKAVGIGRQPNFYPIYEPYRERRVRRCVVQDYLIYYRIETDHVAIIDFRHGARDEPQHL